LDAAAAVDAAATLSVCAACFCGTIVTTLQPALQSCRKIWSGYKVLWPSAIFILADLMLADSAVAVLL
jgi:hypothetical protein